MKITLPGLAIACASMVFSSAARAVDVDINLGGHPPRPVVVAPAAVVERVWVPDRVVQRTERVMVEPARIEKRAETVCVQPAQVIKKQERVLVKPGRMERVRETVLVQPERAVREWVPPVTENVRLGPVNVTRTVQEGYFRDVKVPAEYKTVIRDVEVPAQYDVVVRDVQVPPRYETVYRDVQIPPRFQDITRDEVIPGHWEERTVVGPPVVVEPRSRPLLDIDLEFGKHKHHDRDHDR